MHLIGRQISALYLIGRFWLIAEPLFLLGQWLMNSQLQKNLKWIFCNDAIRSPKQMQIAILLL
jgi:hypothetical protein